MFQMPQKCKMPNTLMRRVSLGSYFLRILFLVQLSLWGERLSQRGLRQRQEGHCVLSLSHRSHRPTSGREETTPLFLPSAAGHQGQEAGGLQRLRDAAGGTTTHSDVLEVRTQLFFPLLLFQLSIFMEVIIWYTFSTYDDQVISTSFNFVN